MKMPNGYGSVFKLPGNRRKPWSIRITVDRFTDEAGKTHWKYKYLGYYETKAEALIALAHFNENPYDMDANKTTFAEVYQKWSMEYFPKISHSNIVGYNAAYALFKPIEKMRFNDIRLAHLQWIIDESGKNYPTLKKAKILLNQIYKFAMQNDICSKDYAQYVDINQYKDRNPNKIDHTPFTTEEIKKVWEWKDASEYITIVLMLIYTGLRIGELLDLKKENVNLSERSFDVTASKTKAGIRKVPIAKKVLPFFEYWYNRNDCPYLVSNCNGQHFDYRNYKDSYWQPYMDQMGLDHLPHDTRHTCISLLTAAGIDERIIKKIVGHAGNGVTETVYTHFEIQQLLDAIDQI